MLTLQLGVDGREIKAELAGVLGLEGGGFKFDHYVATQLEVIKEQIDEEVFPADLQRHLATHVGEAGSQLQQEAGDVLDQGVFNRPFPGLLPQTEEVESVGILERFTRQIRHRRR